MKFRIIVLLPGLLLASIPLRAEDIATWEPTVNIDAFASGNLGKHNQATANAFCSTFIGVGATNCSSPVTNYGAYGARFGLMRQSEDWSFGPSAGYLYGGPATGKVDVTITPTGEVVLKDTNNTFRLLAEGARRFALNDDWALTVGTGLGWSLVNEHLTCNASGALATACAGVGKTTNTGWITWEVTPSVWFKSWQFGVRYAGFARGRYLPWNTFGGTFGYRF